VKDNVILYGIILHCLIGETMKYWKDLPLGLAGRKRQTFYKNGL
jgi:hypothetical protein